MKHFLKPAITKSCRNKTVQTGAALVKGEVKGSDPSLLIFLPHPATSVPTDLGTACHKNNDPAAPHISSEETETQRECDLILIDHTCNNPVSSKVTL